MSDEANPTPAPKVDEPTPTPEPTPAPTQLVLPTGDAAALAAAQARAVEAERKLKAQADTAAAAGAAAQLAEVEARATAAEAQLATAQARVAAQGASLTKAAALAALPGLKDSDTFWPVISANVQLNDEGQLTEEATAWLATFREQKPYLFDADAPVGTTAIPGVATRKPGGYDDETLRAFTEARTTPGHYKESDLWPQYQGLFKNLGRQ